MKKMENKDALLDKSVLVSIIHQSLWKIKRYLKHMQQGMAVEDVHQFRVEIKKLRAFLRMISAIQQNRISIPKRLKEEYRKAGSVRDLQLLLANTNKSTLENDYQRKLDKKKKELIRQTGKVKISRLIKRTEKEITGELPDNLPVSLVSQFLANKLRFVGLTVKHRSLSDTEIHSARKSLKDVLYDVKSVEDNAPTALRQMHWQKEKREFYTHLAEDLGKYQDCVTEVTTLEHWRRPKKKKDRKDLAHLVTEQKKLKAQLRTSIRKQFAELKAKIQK